MPSAPLALVARAADGIGRAVSLELARQGYDVVVHFEQDDEGADATAGSVREAGQDAYTLPGRLGDGMVAGSLVRRIGREIGTLDALVVCPRREPIAEAAGVEDTAEAFLGIGLGQVEPVLQADLKGPVGLLQRAAEAMRQSDGGRALVTSTGAGLRSGPAGAPARAAAAGLVSFVETAAEVLAPEVCVNALVPGLVLGEEAPARNDRQDPQPDALLEGREDAWSSPRAVASTAVHLLQAPAPMAGQIVRLGRGLGDERLRARPFGETRAGEMGLPGIEQRVQPPDPEDRIELDDAGEEPGS